MNLTYMSIILQLLQYYNEYETIYSIIAMNLKQYIIIMNIKQYITTINVKQYTITMKKII